MAMLRVNLGRNDPCWCRSGKKFKKCHLDRDRQPRVRLDDALQGVRRLFQRRVCLAPDASDCGEIIKAHSVQRAGGLSRIARDGHIYSFRFDAGRYRKGAFEPILVGLRDASTFAGFCQNHDGKLFEPIERADLVPTAEQAALLAYRAICRELYNKIACQMQVPILQSGDRGRPIERQLSIQAWAASWGAAMTSDVVDLRRAKALYDDAIVSHDFSGVRWVAIFFDRAPDVLSAACGTPGFDFQGRRIQNLYDLARPADQFGFSLLPTAMGGAAILSWLPADSVAREFARSLLNLPASAIPHALVRYAFNEFENIHLAPRWWDGLPAATRRALVSRFNTTNLPPFHQPGSLADDGLRAVEWQVVAVEDRSGP